MCAVPTVACRLWPLTHDDRVYRAAGIALGWGIQLLYVTACFITILETPVQLVRGTWSCRRSSVVGFSICSAVAGVAEFLLCRWSGSGYSLHHEDNTHNSDKREGDGWTYACMQCLPP